MWFSDVILTDDVNGVGNDLQHAIEFRELAGNRDRIIDGNVCIVDGNSAGVVLHEGELSKRSGYVARDGYGSTRMKRSCFGDGE